MYDINQTKCFVSNDADIFERVTSETDTHYICGNTLFIKSEVITDYHPLDDIKGKLHLHIQQFVN